MRSEKLEYSSDVGLTGTLYLPEVEAPHSGVLVFPDIFGLGGHAHERAARLANAGFAALAADLHGMERRLDPPAATAELELFYARPDIPCERGRAALATLSNRADIDANRIAAIGFCYGGTLALELARCGSPLVGIVGFHSVLTSTLPTAPSQIRGKVLACIGGEDPAVPAAQRTAFETEMRAAGVDWQLHTYGGVYHTFTDRDADKLGLPDFARYSPSADARSWNAMISFLREVLLADREAELANPV